MWSCYLLSTPDGKHTYIGATVDPDRRLRQHNGALKGGARATRRCREWKRVLLVQPFPEQRDALQFEWMWKRQSRRQNVENKILCAYTIIKQGYSTSSSIPFEFYPELLRCHVEDSSPQPEGACNDSFLKPAR
jgi:predicted GIY-YIG superfamily endonuclease